MPGRGPLYVHVDHDGKPCLAARLHACVEGHHEWAELEVDPRWARRPEARRYAPMLAVAPACQSTGASMPLLGAVGDSAPDRWGRTLMRRMERRRARLEKREPRVLREADFLLGVDDDIREGCLRFSRRANGPFLGDRGRKRLPRLADLRRLLEAVRAHEEDRSTLAQAELLLISGQLLGGSRPKATVVDDDGRLWVAKFPSGGDGRDMQRWEALVLGLAADCGIEVPRSRLASIDGERILLLERFDRDASGQRLGMVSAYGLLAAQDNEAGSYVVLAELVRSLAAQPAEALRQLWLRALFSVLISDKDNHLRNHGMLLDREGWRLCPAYDMNPEPEPRRPRQVLLSIDGVDDRATLDVALHVATRFGVRAMEARRDALAMATVLRTWRARAAALRLPAGEVRKMRSVFESEDLRRALRLRVGKL